MNLEQSEMTNLIDRSINPESLVEKPLKTNWRVRTNHETFNTPSIIF